MQRFLSKLANTIRPTDKARAARRGARRPSLQVEALESRQLLSVSPLPLPLPLPHPLPIDPIQLKYQSLGGAGGILGKSLSGELATPYGGGLYEKFQNGAIFYSASTGAHDVLLPTENEYFATVNEKDAGGNVVEKLLGLPTSDQTNVSGIPGAQFTSFQGGKIYWSQATGAHDVYGLIGVEYAATANEWDYYGNVVQNLLGMPTSDEMNVPGVAGGRMNTFQGGAIYWSNSTGAHVVYGGIGAKYNSLGGAAAYGLPTSDEQWLPNDQLLPDVRVSFFAGGRAIYWTPATGAHAVYGAIEAEYQATFYETDYYGNIVRNILGAPTSDEMYVPGMGSVPGDPRMNTFQGGVIYWSPSTGAHVVYGGIGGLYNSMGGPTSYLGLPTGDEQGIPGGREQYFQHGKIVWTPGGGAYAVKTVSQMTFNTGTINLGDVQGWAQLTLYANGSYNFVGHFHDNGFWSYNDSLVLGVMSPSGVLYTFSHTGHVAGTSEFWDSRDDNWDVSGTNAALAAGWADLQGARWHWNAQTSSALSALLSDVESALGVAASIIAIV